MRAIRNAYAEEGVDAFYASSGATYRNPHEEGVRDVVTGWVPSFPRGRVLDLACGSGEVTLALRAAGVDDAAIDACDPYTGAAFRERCGRDCFSWSFADLDAALEKEKKEKRAYAVVVCSFALHLCEPSRLPSLLQTLARHTQRLLIVSPHKKPVIKDGWGFALLEERYDEAWRVRSRWFSA